MNIITATQTQILESKGFPISRLTSHLRIFRQGNDAIDATALKKLCPFIITSGQNEHGFYATTRQSKPEWVYKNKVKVAAIDNSAHYVYGNSECEAICKLLVKHVDNRIFSPSDSDFKMPLNLPL